MALVSDLKSTGCKDGLFTIEISSLGYFNMESFNAIKIISPLTL